MGAQSSQRMLLLKTMVSHTVVHVQLLSFLQEMISATPEELGEVKAETPEERAERAERVLTAALAGLAALTQALCNAPGIKRDASSSDSKTDSNGSANGADSPGQHWNSDGRPIHDSSLIPLHQTTPARY